MKTHREESPAARAEPAALPAQARWAIVSLSLSMLLSALGTSIANVGLPTLVQAFGAPFAQVQWVVLAYLLAITTVIVSVGRLGDLFGRRRLLLAGIGVFSAASVLCALAPSLAWLKERPWKWLLQMPLPRLGYLQPTPRWAVEPVVRKLVPGGEQGWTAAGVDEFLRAYLTPSGRFAFYECARNIYLEEPYGGEGFWTRLKKLEPAGLFVWGDQDTLVPKSFMRHVERALPRSSAHLELDCGHVPQMERPIETHDAVHAFLTT